MNTHRQFDLLREWIGAIVDEKIEQAFNRNSSVEGLRRMKLEADLIKLIEESKDDIER